MAGKTFKFVDFETRNYWKRKTSGDGTVGKSDTSYGILAEQSNAEFGFIYHYHRDTMSGSYFRFRDAQTYASVIKFSVELNSYKPDAANTYECELNFPVYASMSEYVNICVLDNPLPSRADSAYIALKNLTATATVIPTGSIVVSLTQSELMNAIKYGIAIIPVREAEISDIANFTDINVNGDHSFYRNGMIKGGTAQVIYTVTNLANPGRASMFSPSQASILVQDQDNTISWMYNQDFGAAQYYLGITLTYLSTGETLTLCRKKVYSIADGKRGSYVLPANSLKLGRIRLTVAVMPQAAASYYNDSDAIWLTGATVDYTVKESPEAGDANCDGKPNPTVAWQSTAQAAYQVRFGEFDSGVIAGRETAYRIPRIFDDGNYMFSVRTASSDGEWSEWTDEVYVAIKNTPPLGEVILSAERFDANVKLSWTSTVSADNYAVYRDGELIDVTTGTTCIDRYSNGKAVYYVRAMVSGNYAESNHVTYTLKLRYDLISDDGGYSYKVLKYTPSPKMQSDSYTDDITYQYYSGREKPIAILSGRTERSKHFMYAAKSREELLFLKQMRGKPVLVKNSRGCVIYGIINELKYSEAFVVTVSFAVREIYREGEVVDYV